MATAHSQLNPESLEANQATNKVRDRQRIIEFLQKRDIRGATCDEICAALRIPSQTASARTSDMLKEGVLIRKPSTHGEKSKWERRKTRTGSYAAVLMLARLGCLF